jgi:hypothetical protein
MKFLSLYIVQLVPIFSASSGASAQCSGSVLSAHCQELNAHYSGLSIQCPEPSAKSPGTQCPMTSAQPVTRARTCKCSRSQGIDSQPSGIDSLESIPGLLKRFTKFGLRSHIPEPKAQCPACPML